MHIKVTHKNRRKLKTKYIDNKNKMKTKQRSVFGIYTEVNITQCQNLHKANIACMIRQQDRIHYVEVAVKKQHI